MIVALGFTFVIYFVSIILFKSVLDMSFILNDFVWAKIIFITLISWLPFYIFKKLKSYFFPDKLEKLRRYKKEKDSKTIETKELKETNSNFLG